MVEGPRRKFHSSGGVRPLRQWWRRGVFAQQIAELVGNLRGKAVDVPVEGEKAVVEADIMDALEGGFGRAEGADDQAEGHGLERGGGGGK